MSKDINLAPLDNKKKQSGTLASMDLHLHSTAQSQSWTPSPLGHWNKYFDVSVLDLYYTSNPAC